MFFVSNIVPIHGSLLSLGKLLKKCGPRSLANLRLLGPYFLRIAQDGERTVNLFSYILSHFTTELPLLPLMWPLLLLLDLKVNLSRDQQSSLFSWRKEKKIYNNVTISELILNLLKRLQWIYPKGAFTRSILKCDFALCFHTKCTSWGQCYKTFSVRDLHIFVLS